MAKMSRKQIEAWDKQNTAMHEAAHLTVAVAKGIFARAAVCAHHRQSCGVG
jgi:hypothetical protein